MGTNNNSYVSYDYGQTWSWSSYPSGYLYQVDMSDDGDIIVTTIYTTDNRFWNGVWTLNNNNLNSSYLGWRRSNTSNYNFSPVAISSTGEYGVILFLV